MGLLDDAIREHLDLKRRRGADPGDVERAEREALGPVRRAPTAQNVEVTDERHAEAGLAYDEAEADAGWSGDPPDDQLHRAGEAEPDFGDESSLEPEGEPQAQPEQRPSRLARIFGRTVRKPEPEEAVDTYEPDSADSLDDPRDELQSRRTPVPHPAGRPVEQETTEYDLEAELGAMSIEAKHEPADGEDVLEETPEFLQDTPDHDRLWFEQRPPKDFDFDH